MRFANLSILTKVMSVVGVLTTLAIIISVLATLSLEKLDGAIVDMNQVATAASLAPHITVNLTGMSRGEMRVAANPAPEEITAVRAINEKERAEAGKHIEMLKPLLDESQRAIMADFEEVYPKYLASMENTMTTAEKLGSGIVVEADQKRILDAAKQSRDNAEQLRKLMRDIGADLDQQASDLATESHNTYESMLWTLIIVSAAGILLGGIIGFLIAQFGISRPIRNLVEVLRRLSEGDLKVEVTDSERRDEVGAIAKTTHIFKENLERTRQMEAAAEEQKRQAEVEKRRLMNEMADSFESSVKGIVQSVSSSATQLQGNAQGMSSTAEETARQANVVAAATEQAAGNVQTVAAAAEELTSSISEISRQVGESARIAREAVGEVQRTNTGVAGLSDAAQRIGTVVQIIQDIASQTNLLALNATIEAARAGEAGKGFAVVASEVKNLATQTAKATEDISGQVTAIQAETTSAVAAIQSIGSTVDRINEIATGIASAVEEQSAATQEIARNVQQAAAGTGEVSRNIVGVNDAAAEAGRSASEVLSAASGLSQQSEQLSTQVDAFIGRIRAA